MKELKTFWGDYPVKDTEEEEIFTASIEPINVGGIFFARLLLRFFAWVQTRKKFRVTIDVDPATEKSCVKFSFVNDLNQ